MRKSERKSQKKKKKIERDRLTYIQTDKHKQTGRHTETQTDNKQPEK